MWLPPDAMHFHSGTGCCTTQSGPGAEVKLFASSAAETKEQWERQSEHSERTYYQPRGTQAQRYQGELWFLGGFICSWICRVDDTSKRTSAITETHTHTHLPFHSSVARSRGWCHLAVLVEAMRVWSYSWWSWFGAWWELLKELEETERVRQN